MKKKTRRSRVRKGNTKNWGQRGTSVPMPVTVAIPSGVCPFLMDDADEETVREWIIELTKWKADPITYKQSVYTYWARHSFDHNTDGYKNAKSIIERLVPERVKRVTDLSFYSANPTED